MITIKETLSDYARGGIGGFLFSLPLLYTMEVWWKGFIVSPETFLIYMILTFVILLGYNKYAGIHKESTVKEILFESVEEMGMGFIIAFLILFLIGQIDFVSMSYMEILGKVIMESMLVAIGISVGKAQLGQGDGNGAQGSNGKTGEAVLAFCGCILIAGNIAPTEEILIIAYLVGPIDQLFLVLISLLLGYLILYSSGFKGTGKGSEEAKFEIYFDVMVAYVIAMLTSALILWLFGRFDQVAFDVALGRIIVLSFPAMLGACAGRLLLKH